VRGRRGDEGAAAVEFALVSLLLFTLLFAILQYGFYFYQLSSANAASREAARLAATGVKDCDNDFLNAVKSRASGITVVGLQTTVTDPPVASPEDGQVVNVKVTYNITRFGFPFVPFISGSTQTQTGKARVESPGSVATCTW
jgi:Flp pilus assembly protein TadG